MYLLVLHGACHPRSRAVTVPDFAVYPDSWLGLSGHNRQQSVGGYNLAAVMDIAKILSAFLFIRAGRRHSFKRSGPCLYDICRFLRFDPTSISSSVRTDEKDQLHLTAPHKNPDCLKPTDATIVWDMSELSPLGIPQRLDYRPFPSRPL